MGIEGFHIYQGKWETAAMLDYNKMVASMVISVNGLQEDGSFYGDLGECKKILRTDLVWTESGKIPLLCKLN